MKRLFERKFEVFARRAKLFKYVPFVEFVFLSGSMVTLTLKEDSDFDVIVGVRGGRIFTAWFLSSALYELFGWRETPLKPKKDKIGLGHFATPSGYRLGEPHGGYWQYLYERIIPVMGSEEKFAEFFLVNDWMNPRRGYVRHEKYLGECGSIWKYTWEFVLGGWLGDLLESYLRRRLTARIERQLPEKTGYKPRVRYGDERLEFYRDTRRIEEWEKMAGF